MTEDRPGVLDQSGRLFVKLGASDGRTWIRRLLDKAGTVDVHPWLLQRFEAAKPLPVGEFTEALEEVDAFRSAMLGFMEDYDVILCPAAAFPAPEHRGVHEEETTPLASYTNTYNLTGWPGAGGAWRLLPRGAAHWRPGSRQALAGGRGPRRGQEARTGPGRMAAPAIVAGGRPKVTKLR